MVEKSKLWSKSQNYGRKVKIMVEKSKLWSKSQNAGRKVKILVETSKFGSKIEIVGIENFQSKKIINLFYLHYQAL